MVIKWTVSVMGNHNRRALWNKKLSLRTIPQRHFEAKFCIVSAKYFAIFPIFTFVKGLLQLIQCGSGCEKRWRKHWVQIECSASVEDLDGCSVEGNECGVVLVLTLIRLQWYLGANTSQSCGQGLDRHEKVLWWRSAHRGSEWGAACLVISYFRLLQISGAEDGPGRERSS